MDICIFLKCSLILNFFLTNLYQRQMNFSFLIVRVFFSVIGILFIVSDAVLKRNYFRELLCVATDGRPRNVFGSVGTAKSSCPTRCCFTRKYLNSASRPNTSGESRKVKENLTGDSFIQAGHSSKRTSRTECLINRQGPPNKSTSPELSFTTLSGS